MNPVALSPAVKSLVILSVGAFLIQLFGDSFLNTHILQTLGLVPALFFEKKFLWQPFTYLFMHADLFHLLLNMFILWMLGSELENLWGSKEFLKYFFITGTAAAVFYLSIQAFFRGTTASMIPLVGSSGAVYGLLVAYGIIFSERTMLFMMIFPIKAKHFVLVLAGIEFVSTVFYTSTGVANAAHLGGMVVGFVYLILKAYFKIKIKKAAGSPKRKVPKASYLKLVVNNNPLKDFEKDDDEEPSTFH